MKMSWVSRWWEKRGSRPRTALRFGRQTFRPSMEILEDRTAPAVLIVNSAADNNVRDTGLTLREAILLTNGGLTYGALSSLEKAQVSSSTLGVNDTIEFASTVAGQPIDLTAFDDSSFGPSAFLISSQVTIVGDSV